MEPMFSDEDESKYEMIDDELIYMDSDLWNLEEMNNFRGVNLNKPVFHTVKDEDVDFVIKNSQLHNVIKRDYDRNLFERLKTSENQLENIRMRNLGITSYNEFKIEMPSVAEMTRIITNLYCCHIQSYTKNQFMKMLLDAERTQIIMVQNNSCQYGEIVYPFMFVELKFLMERFESQIVNLNEKIIEINEKTRDYELEKFGVNEISFILQDNFNDFALVDEGRNSKIFLATNLGMMKKVALKVMIPADSIDLIKKDAIRALFILNHENIVKLDAAYRINQIIIMVMEFIPLNLSIYRLTYLNKKKIMEQLLSAVKHIESNGVKQVHLRKSNILITVDGDIKITGFANCVLPRNQENDQPSVAQSSNMYPKNRNCDILGVGQLLFYIVTGEDFSIHEEAKRTRMKKIAEYKKKMSKFIQSDVMIDLIIDCCTTDIGFDIDRLIKALKNVKFIENEIDSNACH